jgi:hypothetical protein
VIGFIASAKGAVERATWQHLQRRKAKRARRARALAAQALAAAPAAA